MLDEDIDSFSWSNFPLSENGHTVFLLKNDSYIRWDDRRLRIHFSTECRLCGESSVMRNTFPKEYDDVDFAVALYSFIVISKYHSNSCV